MRSAISEYVIGVVLSIVVLRLFGNDLSDPDFEVVRTLCSIAGVVGAFFIAAILCR